jgi:hypothetical protein
MMESIAALSLGSRRKAPSRTTCSFPHAPPRFGVTVLVWIASPVRFLDTTPSADLWRLVSGGVGKVQPHRAAELTVNPVKPDWRTGVGCNDWFGTDGVGKSQLVAKWSFTVMSLVPQGILSIPGSAYS